MLDWNYDGKIDYKDHAFYNNVVEPGINGSKNSFGVRDIDRKSSARSSSAEIGRGVGIFIRVVVLCLIIKLIGG